ncbi:MAG TPA: FlgO family outer membrane protein [Candidatus Angelobacter sp.]|jgi:TolB-like protein|nr:FlgO family outer membrane protein [Candidatus Angelobacter sp.]
MLFRIQNHSQKRTPGHVILGLFFVVAMMLSQATYASSHNDEIDGLSTRLADNIAKSGKKSVAVVDFTNLGGEVIELGRFLAEEFSVALAQKANGFDVIDRTYLKAILQEHKLAATGIIDPLTARKLGQIAGVEMLVTGSITPLGDTVRVSVKVLDTATAKVIGAATGDIPKTKAVEELLGRNIATGEGRPSSLSSASPTGSSSPGPSSKEVEDNDFIFQIKGCFRSGSNVTCTGSVTNKAQIRRQLWFNRADILDELGNQYQDGSLQLGAQGGNQSLEPDLRMNFSVMVKTVSVEARMLNIILEYSFSGAQNRYNLKVALRNIPIQQR